MSKKDIHKDQLLAVEEFIRYCNHDDAGIRPRLSLTEEFLQAGLQDKLITPVLVDDGTNFYSPHQLFLVVGLRENVLKKGRLSSKEQLVFSPVPTRSIRWGSNFGFSVNAKTGKPSKLPSQIDIPEISSTCDRFLQLLHSQHINTNAQTKNYQHDRLFKTAPDVDFDLSTIGDKSKTVLKQYRLTSQQLVTLRFCIGQLAMEIDPNEHWYYYLQRHPQWRKDKLKGDAGLAQELYLTESLITHILQITTGVKPSSLIELLHADSPRSILTPEIEYAGGCDTKALLFGISQLENWSNKPINEELLPPNFSERLSNIKARIASFIGMYGEQSYLHGVMRQVELSDKSLDDLDQETRQTVEARMKNYSNTWVDEAGNTHFKTAYFKELEHQSDLTFDKKVELDFQWVQQGEISSAIEDKLTFIQADLQKLGWEVKDNFISNTDKAWRELNEYPGRVRTEEENKQGYKNALSWKKRSEEFSSLLNGFGFAFCAVCHSEPVQLHYERGDRQASTTPVCDTCFDNIDSKALGMTFQDWAAITGSELYCDDCINKKGKRVLLYKFGQNNLLSLWSKTDAAIKVNFDYGRATISAKCPQCDRVYQKVVDWGWGH